MRRRSTVKYLALERLYTPWKCLCSAFFSYLYWLLKGKSLDPSIKILLYFAFYRIQFWLQSPRRNRCFRLRNSNTCSGKSHPSYLSRTWYHCISTNRHRQNCGIFITDHESIIETPYWRTDKCTYHSADTLTGHTNRPASWRSIVFYEYQFNISIRWKWWRQFCHWKASSSYRGRYRGMYSRQNDCPFEYGLCSS